MEDRIMRRIAELREEHAARWRDVVMSPAWRDLQRLEGALIELEKLVPKEAEAIPTE
jgi:hypothetical protein